MRTAAPAALCPVVVGRDAELADVDALLDAARSGRGAVLVVEGDAGMGKSRLAREAVDRSAGLGLRVGVGRASATVLAPFRPLAEALLSASRGDEPPQDPRLAPYRPALARIVPDWAASGATVDASLVVVAEAMLRALTALAGGRGLLVVLEDLHWADTETLAVFEYVADNIAGSAVAILATTRPAPGDASRLARRLHSRRAAVHCVLPSLDDGEVLDVAAACLQVSADDVPEGLSNLLRDHSGGLPLLVEDLVAALVAGGRLRNGERGWQFDQGDAPLPTRFSEVVAGRLADLDPQALAVLQAASVFGPRFDWDLLGPTTGLPPEQVAAGLRQALGSQLLAQDGHGFRFRHALTCDVVLASLDPISRVDVHARAAAALEGSGRADGADPLLARLLIGSGQTGRGLQLLMQAAEDAVDRGALRTAEAHLREAIRRAGDGPAALDAEVALLRVLVLAGDAGALELGRRLPEELRRAGRSSALPGVLLLAARAAATAGSVDEARRVLTEARHGADGRQRAEIAVIEATLHLAAVTEDRLVGAAHLGGRAVAAAEAAGAPDLVCEALEIVGRCSRVRSLTEAETSFARALQEATDHDLPLWRIRALNELGTIDMFRDVDARRLLLSRQEATDAGALHIAAGVDVNLAAVFTMRGDCDTARGYAEECRALAARCQLPQLEAVGHLFLGVIATHQARFADMRTHVRHAEALGGADPDVLVGTWGMCRAMASLLREDHTRAGREFDTAAARLVDRPALAINPVDGPRLLLRAVRGEASAAEVERYAAAQAIGARWSAMWAELARGVVAGRGGDGDGAGRATASVAAAIETGRPMPLFLAVGLRLVGEAAVDGGWGDPATWLQEAAATLRASGHAPAAAACRDLLRRTGRQVARDRRADADVPAGLRARGVTAREHEVLGLVVERLNNRQIADRLFLSPRTVEKHVASLLTKLQAARRDDLALVAEELASA